MFVPLFSNGKETVMIRRMKSLATWLRPGSIVVLTVLILTLLPYGGFKAYAGAINTASDTLSTIKQSVVANHTIQFTMNASDAVAATETITITFPSGFDL